MKRSAEIKEWVGVLKEQITEIYQMYRPAEGTALHQVGSESILQNLADLILKAGSKREALFYLVALEKMIHQLALNHVDVLSIHRTGESLQAITQAYDQLLRTYKGKIAVATQNFQNLLNTLTGDLQPRVPEGKFNFADSIAALAQNFLKQAKELRADLKSTPQKSKGPAQKKIIWLIKTAEEIAKLAQELQKNPSPAETMRLLAQLRDKNEQFIKISHTNGFDLSERSPKLLPTPTSLDKCSDTIRRVHFEIKQSFPSLLFTGDGAEKMLGLGLSMGGITVQGVDSFPSVAGQVTSSADIAYTGMAGAQDLHKDFQRKKYAKLGMVLAGGVGISLVAVLAPTVLPFLLTGLVVGDNLNIIKNVASQLKGSVDDQKQFQQAISLVETFFNSAKTDLENRRQSLTEQRQLKQDILESKNPVEHLPKLESVARQQCTLFAKSLVAGNESALAAELRQVIGGELLVQGSKKEFTYHILMRLQEKLPEPGAIAKLLNSPPRDCSRKLKNILEKEVKPKLLEKFADHVYSCRTKARQYETPRLS